MCLRHSSVLRHSPAIASCCYGVDGNVNPPPPRTVSAHFLSLLFPVVSILILFLNLCSVFGTGSSWVMSFLFLFPSFAKEGKKLIIRKKKEMKKKKEPVFRGNGLGFDTNRIHWGFYVTSPFTLLLRNLKFVDMLNVRLIFIRIPRHTVDAVCRLPSSLLLEIPCVLNSRGPRWHSG